MPRFALDIESVPRPVRSQALLDAVNHRVVIADGAMGTMLQRTSRRSRTTSSSRAATRSSTSAAPDMIGDIHDEYFAVGIDAVETNTFGANWSTSRDYGIDDRIAELAEAGARIARERGRSGRGRDGRMRWVLGSMGPGTKLPSLGHTTYDHLKQTFAAAGRGPHRRRRGRLPHRDLAGPPADQGRRQRLQAGDRQPRHPAADLRRGDRRDHRHHAHGQRDRRRAHRPRTARRRRDRPELRHRPGRDERAPAPPLEALARAGGVHAERRAAGARRQRRALSARRPTELATAHEQFVREFGLGLVGGCCGTTPEHMRRRRRAAAPARAASPRGGCRGIRSHRAEAGVARLYQHVPFTRSPRTSRSASAPTRTGRRRSARRCSTSAGTTASRSPASRSASARTCSTCASTTWGATAWPTSARSSRVSRAPRRCRS